MNRDANLPPEKRGADPADEARLLDIGAELVATVDAVVAPWIERLVVDRVRDWSGHDGADVAAAAASAGEAARQSVVPELAALLATDLDDQRDNPMAVLRRATRFANAVLDGLGLPDVPRDPFAKEAFPEDRFNLVPARWDDVHDSLLEVGIRWGAAKAFVHRARHAPGGRRFPR